ncbi:hypothetical protein M9Y10_026301 [Tritrichomonas musculus]|uniref:Secreted protein n=1 Tax=Tritrichomonas musculus TaxID=1915356 RepID=A0ABR2H782_9EUKA
MAFFNRFASGLRNIALRFNFLLVFRGLYLNRLLTSSLKVSRAINDGCLIQTKKTVRDDLKWPSSSSSSSSSTSRTSTCQ